MIKRLINWWDGRYDRQFLVVSPLSPNDSTDEQSPYSLTLSGKLLLEHQLPVDKDELIQKKYLTKIPAITKKHFDYTCHRCGNRVQRFFGSWPCRCGDCVYCRKCVVMGRVSFCSSLYIWTGPRASFPCLSNACAWEGELSRYQRTASGRIREAVDERSRLLVWAVCGAGKTEMLFAGLEKAFAEGKRVCLATPRADVVRELRPRFARAFPDIKIVARYGGSEEVDEGAQFLLATTHQLLYYARAFDVMIIDEVDAFPYHSDPMLPYSSARALKTDGSLIYLTATPRLDLKIRSHLNILPTVFVPQRFHGHPLPVPVFRSSFDLKRRVVPKGLKVWLQEKKKAGRRVLLFASTIEKAEKLTIELPGSIAAHSEDPERETKIQRFREKEVDLLITTTILERGVTFPSIDVAVLDAGHDVFDEAALVQIAGRAGRSPDDPSGDVVFFHNGASDGMVNARDSIRRMNKLAEKGAE
ncbi:MULTISPECIES: DEAD/DEAH box helicase [Pontibacillus]|uniref:Helicase-related protein n=1 Tax=Pontibacillus chungwhensis TaxID=265426 RepID=A0ABY8UVV0_9BACI|nr:MULTISPECIES: helicase-related protein [Pontibacillus]MCD5325917.1 DEAD/DEAH box helicase family protein [Pontibacillus sp. HN14]WIF97627.1 helicase-related protein [Pontibacillus chungwhensis]